MAQRGYTRPQQAYASFLAEVATRVAPSTPMFWQDAFQRAEPGTPLPAAAIIQFYKAGPIAAAAARHPVVYADNSAWGLDIHTSTKSWRDFYSVDPTAGLNSSAVRNLIGGEACVWTVTFDASVLATALWPRLLAVSERLWSPGALTANTTTNDALKRRMWARCALNARGIPAGSALGNLVPDDAPLYGSCLLQ
jgi:hexosaminidase